MAARPIRSRILKYAGIVLVIGTIGFVAFNSFLTLKENQVAAIQSANGRQTEVHYALDYPTAEEKENGVIPVKSLFSCVHNEAVSSVIKDFSELMQSLAVETELIEPSLLFCLLSSDHRKLLKVRRFDLAKHIGTENVVHFAVKDHQFKLDKENASEKIENAGFRHWAVLNSVQPWMKNVAEGQAQVALHHFFSKGKMLVHAVMFYNRSNYLWHGQLAEKALPDDLKSIVQQGSEMLFTKASAYEKFGAKTVVMDEFETNLLHIPSSPEYFLMQIPTATMLECDPNRTTPINVQNLNADLKNHYNQLVQAFHDSSQDLKVNLKPHLINFQISGGTLLGWYRNCDIIPFTTDVDFYASSLDVENKDFWVRLFNNNSNAKMDISMMMGVPEEAFEFAFRTRGNRQRVDLFFLYETEDGKQLWVSGHRPSGGYYFRYLYPKFTLCSGDLLGEKVHMPCRPEDMIHADYGTEWRRPIAGWNYESSPKNTGPKVYWSKDIISQTYQEFS